MLFGVLLAFLCSLASPPLPQDGLFPSRHSSAADVLQAPLVPCSPSHCTYRVWMLPTALFTIGTGIFRLSFEIPSLPCPPALCPGSWPAWVRRAPLPSGCRQRGTSRGWRVGRREDGVFIPAPSLLGCGLAAPSPKTPVGSPFPRPQLSSILVTTSPGAVQASRCWDGQFDVSMWLGRTTQLFNHVLIRRGQRNASSQ